MAKKKSVNAIISCIIYPFDVLISINETNEDFVKSLEKYGADTGDVKIITLADTKKYRGRTVMTPDNHTMIRLNFMPKTNEDYAMLVHELFHATDFILRTIGIKLSGKSDEAYAYLLGYLTEKAFDLIAK